MQPPTEPTSDPSTEGVIIGRQNVAPIDIPIDVDGFELGICPTASEGPGHVAPESLLHPQVAIFIGGRAVRRVRVDLVTVGRLRLSVEGHLDVLTSGEVVGPPRHLGVNGEQETRIRPIHVPRLQEPAVFTFAHLGEPDILAHGWVVLENVTPLLRRAEVHELGSPIHHAHGFFTPGIADLFIRRCTGAPRQSSAK